MADPFSSYASGLDSPGTRHFAITPSNGADLAVRPRALYVNAGTTVTIRDEGGTDVLYNVVPQQVLPFRGVRILATGTDATLIGWY